MSGQRPRSISLAAASDYFFVLVDFRKAKIKREFRALRSASQGSALRTRKPFEKGLSESFISPAGGLSLFLHFGYLISGARRCGFIMCHDIEVILVLDLRSTVTDDSDNDCVQYDGDQTAGESIII